MEGRLPGYVLYNHFLAKPFQDMSKKEAEDNFKYFVDQIPSRIEILEYTVKKSAGIRLDGQEATLRRLGSWFAEVSATMRLTQKEIDRDKSQMPDHLVDFVPEWDIDEQTISLCFDVGAYFAEMLRRDVPGTQWFLIMKPKNDADYNQPVLLSVGKKIWLNPFGVMTSLARGFVDHTTPPEKFADIYPLWRSNLQKY
ncbi:MAG: hypothetical protein QOJ65_862 [Fimbriimonadaceae bacterium]|jgi:hypothetical protein|nr:hypothetical protein [Fimbriimonadaceae bacterium]